MRDGDGMLDGIGGEKLRGGSNSSSSSRIHQAKKKWKWVLCVKKQFTVDAYSVGISCYSAVQREAHTSTTNPHNQESLNSCRAEFIQKNRNAGERLAIFRYEPDVFGGRKIALISYVPRKTAEKCHLITLQVNKKTRFQFQVFVLGGAQCQSLDRDKWPSEKY